MVSVQSIEAAHGTVKQIGRPLGLPGNQLNPAPDGPKMDHWEESNRRVLSRFNKSCFDPHDLKDIKTAEHVPQQGLSDEELIAAFS